MSGLGVLVMRPEREASRTADKLAALGHKALVAPVLVVRATEIPVPESAFDALAVASARSFDAIDRFPSSWLQRPVFAVGRRTAEAARERGFREVRVGTDDGSSLGALAALTLPRPARLLCLVGQDRKAALENALQAAGFDLILHVAYDARAAGPWPDDVASTLTAGAVQVALHYSRRSAALAIAAARGAGVGGVFAGLRHICFSADCAEPLAQGGIERVSVASSPDEDSLLCLLSPRVGAAGKSSRR